MRAAHVGIGLVLLLACGRPQPLRYEEQAAAAAPAARHAIESERLGEAMRRLQRLSSERLPREMDVHAVRAARTQDVAAAAREISLTAGSIPDALEGVEIEPRARQEFLSLAAELGSHAERLAQQAPGLTSDELEAQVEALDHVCAQCHARFRVLPLAPPLGSGGQQ